MKKIAIVGFLAIVVLASAFKLGSTWTVIDNKVSITFELPEEGTKGTIGGLKASIDFDKDNISNAKITASVDVKTLNSGTAKKDAHLMTADFFDTEKFPTISFVSEKIYLDDKGMFAEGNMTIKDITKPVKVKFAYHDNGPNEAIFEGSVEVFAGDFGIMKKSDTGKDKIIVTISVPVKK